MLPGSLPDRAPRRWSGAAAATSLGVPAVFAFAALATFLTPLSGCGTRTPIPEEELAAPTGPVAPEAGALPPIILPPNHVCYEASATPNIACRVTSATRGRVCTAELDCEGHRFTASCGEDGICRCDNVGFETCYCRVDPRLENACGPARCCFR